jgi:hypothetical protein
MVRQILIVLSLLTLFALTACSEEAPTAGELKDFTAACDKANDGKRVAVVGYLRFPDSFTESQSVVLRMYETDSFSGTPIGVQTTFGTEPNRVEPVKDQFADTDLKVHLSDGTVAGFGTKVKASGKVYFPIVDQEFDCGLENPLIETSQ